MKKILTLCLLQHRDQLLLGQKKRGFGMGKWNGFGGKVQAGEGIEEAAKREMWEESGIVVESLRPRGVLNFTFDDLPDELEVYVFEVLKFTGKAVETEEMKPQWFPAYELPYDKMWADDKYWMNVFLGGKNFTGRFHFKDVHTLISHSVTIE